MTEIKFLRVSPLTSIQDEGRFGALRFGLAASGPMDRASFFRTEELLLARGRGSGVSAIEFAIGHLAFEVKHREIWAAFCGGTFELIINGKPADWDHAHKLRVDDHVIITPGTAGNYGVIRFEKSIDVPDIIASQSTNMIAQLGGVGGRMIKAGDVLKFAKPTGANPLLHNSISKRSVTETGPIRIIWGLHAASFSPAVRDEFLATEFIVSSALDRMGVRLKDDAGVFNSQQKLSLVSDAIVPGDIQILGDGTPIVLMRDHQATGGYPRIGTIIQADIDRFAQLRPGSPVRFISVSVDHAHRLLKRGGGR